MTSTYVPAPAILVNLSRSKDLWGPSSDKNFFHLGKYAGLRFLQCTVTESNGSIGKSIPGLGLDFKLHPLGVLATFGSGRNAHYPKFGIAKYWPYAVLFCYCDLSYAFLKYFI